MVGGNPNVDIGVMVEASSNCAIGVIVGGNSNWDIGVTVGRNPGDWLVSGVGNDSRIEAASSHATEISANMKPDSITLIRIL